MKKRAENKSSARNLVKRMILPRGTAPRLIRGGLLGGLKMDLNFEHHTQRWLGLGEVELSEWFSRYSKGIRAAIDVGANDGAYTLFFLARTSAGQVVSCEPSETCVEQMRRNLELNGYKNDPRLRVISRFVGRNQGNSIALNSISGAVESPCLVKVDIDGGEMELLRGAQELLDRADTRWIIEVHSQILERECLELLKRAGYEATVVPNAWWRVFLPEVRGGDLNRWIVGTRNLRQAGGEPDST